MGWFSKVLLCLGGWVPAGFGSLVVVGEVLGRFVTFVCMNQWHGESTSLYGVHARHHARICAVLYGVES